MEWLSLTVIALIVVGAYVLPSITAVARRAPSSASTVVINILLGWTLVGWAAAMAMALRSHTPSTVVQVQHMPPPDRPGLPSPETRSHSGQPSMPGNGNQQAPANSTDPWV